MLLVHAFVIFVLGALWDLTVACKFFGKCRLHMIQLCALLQEFLKFSQFHMNYTGGSGAAVSAALLTYVAVKGYARNSGFLN